MTSLEIMKMKETVSALKDIAKELHKINEKLDHMSQASIFHPPNTVRITNDGIVAFNSQEKQSI